MRLGPGPMKGPTMGRTLSGKRVLELGCGHGLPGIVALINGAEVHFQASMTSPKPVSVSPLCHCLHNSENKFCGGCTCSLQRTIGTSAFLPRITFLGNNVGKHLWE